MRMLHAAVIGVVLGAVVASASIGAEMPEELKGTWVLNQEATQEYVKQSPKWKAGDEKTLPLMLKAMSRIRYIFSEKSVTVVIGERKQELPVTLKEHKDGKWVFTGAVEGKQFTLTVTLDKKGNLNFRSSASDDMDYYLWQKAKKE